MQVAWRGLVPASVVSPVKIQYFFLICLASHCLVSFVERILPHFWKGWRWWPPNLVPTPCAATSLAVVNRWSEPPLLWEMWWCCGVDSTRWRSDSFSSVSLTRDRWWWPIVRHYCIWCVQTGGPLNLLHAGPFSSSIRAHSPIKRNLDIRVMF